MPRHEYPKRTVRSVSDAMLAAERLRQELPIIVQVKPADWDKVILADEVKRLRCRMRQAGVTVT